MASNEDAKKLPSKLHELLSQQSQCAQQMIDSSLDYLRLAIDKTEACSEQQTRLADITCQNARLKQQHHDIL